MTRTRATVLAALAGAAALLVIGFALAQAARPPGSGIFPATLSDMPRVSYVDGPAAVGEIRALHGNAPDVRIESAYLVQYEGAGTDRARFWISDSRTAAEATLLLESMRRKVAGTGVFSQPIASIVEGVTVYAVTGPPEMGQYNYFYARANSVYWVQVDGADDARRADILAAAVRQVTR